jgi:hypothetical protein
VINKHLGRGNTLLMNQIGFRYFIFVFFLVIAVIVTLYIKQQKSDNFYNDSSCKENDWNCICAHIKDEITCKKYSDCDWTNFHLNDYYCMERFCMTYNKTECEAHDRCMWAFNKLGGDWQCEGVEFVDESRFIIPNKTS